MYSIQEQEERDFMPMTYADEMRWQHSQGMRCSFDCGDCEARAEAKYQTYLFDFETTIEEIEQVAEFNFAQAEAARERELVPADAPPF